MSDHQELAAGRWKDLSLVEQLANIGSEVERALNWKAKNNLAYSIKAFERSLELTDLTLACLTKFSQLREVARMREALVDFFYGTNEFQSTDLLWRKYFLHFAYAARKNR